MEKKKHCNICHYEEEYFGYRCKVCDSFIPYGCEPWLDVDIYIDKEFEPFEELLLS